MDIATVGFEAGGLLIEDVLVRRCPDRQSAPVLFDSPHSGTAYPPDFGFACPLHLLRQAEDTHVEALIDSAPRHGAMLLYALFPRSYIDVNRAIDDIDQNLLDAPWSGKVAITEKTRLGMGLVRRLCKPGVPMYERRLTIPELKTRITRYYQPYHDSLAAALDHLHARFGAVWYVNCHSMPSVANMTQQEGRERADFVLGDRDGTTCDPAFADLAAATLRKLGYGVRINDPYKGVELVRRHGRPGDRRHALQLEVNRRLYMNERTLEPHDGFATLKADLDQLMATICAYARDHAPLTGRDMPV